MNRELEIGAFLHANGGGEREIVDWSDVFLEWGERSDLP